MISGCHLQEDLDILKADINAAYRRIPIRPKHQRLCHIAFLHKGEVVIAQHLGLPFGAVSSVHDWDRVGVLRCLVLVHIAIVFVTGAFLCSLARRVLKIPMKRYVDDLFDGDRRKCILVAMNCFARNRQQSLRI